MKKYYRIICTVVLLTLLLSNIPAYTIATTPSELTEVTTDQSPTIVKEDTTLRGEYEKHFLLSDGSYEAVVYNEPVHRYADGGWQEIDNTLSLCSDTNGITTYQTANGLMDVSFAQNFGEKIVTLKQDDYSVSWDVQAVTSSTRNTQLEATEQPLQPVQAQIIPLNTEGINAEEQKMMAVKSTSTIQYTNALAQEVDLKYTVLPTRVKEDIILKSPKEISAYVVNFYVEGLSARLLENRDIEFYNDDEVVFTMWAPYMYDAASELSEDIAVEMVSKGNGHYIVMLIPNSQWLQDASRVYPVVIDPLVGPSRAQSNIIDNYVWENSGVQNNNLDRLYFGKKSDLIARTYIKFRAMPYIPSQATIVFASMRLYVTSGTSTTNPINAYRVTGGDWESGTISWFTKPGAATLLTSNLSPRNISTDSALAYSFSCLSAVQHWYTGSTTGQNANYGVMIRYADESINDYNAVYSADYSVESSRPRILITYTIPQTTSDIVWPTPSSHVITSPWGYRTYDNEMHYGIDISVYYADVKAAIAGTVSWEYDDAIGTAMTITSLDGQFKVRYFHLSSRSVAAGTVVAAGDTIAVSGNSGSSSGPHLHFQLQTRNGRDESYNPLEIYHRDDQRSAWTNPNPMFILDGDEYIPNPYFNFTYVASDYNDTNGEKWKK